VFYTGLLHFAGCPAFSVHADTATVPSLSWMPLPPCVRRRPA